MKTCNCSRISIVLGILLVMGFGNFTLTAQEAPTCAEKLQTAKSLFERGQVQQVPELISGCLESGFTREESLDAFKLIIQCYLFEEKLAKADSAMLAFLKRYPEYELSPTDHSSFVGLFNNYTSKVIVQFTVRFGGNLPFVLVSESNSHFAFDTEKSYSMSFGLSGSLEAKYRLNSRIEATGAIGYSQISFSSTETTMFAKSTLSESYTRLEIPLGITYDLTRGKKLVPYVRFAAGPAFNMSAKATGTFSPTDLNNHIGRPGPQIDISSSRIFMDLFVQPGGGIKFKIPRGYISAELRANIGLLEQSVFKGYNSANDDADFFYEHADDKFRLNTLNLSLGYTMIFYKPVRKEE